jgi:hypothetical protein
MKKVSLPITSILGIWNSYFHILSILLSEDFFGVKVGLHPIEKLINRRNKYFFGINL